MCQSSRLGKVIIIIILFHDDDDDVSVENQTARQVSGYTGGHIVAITQYSGIGVPFRYGVGRNRLDDSAPASSVDCFVAWNLSWLRGYSHQSPHPLPIKPSWQKHNSFHFWTFPQTYTERKTSSLLIATLED